MTRLLLVEVTDEVHDLTDLVDSMCRVQGGHGRLVAGGYVLDVRVSELVEDQGTIKGTSTSIYTTEGNPR